ncbi:MAG: phosphodiesterase [Rhodospirillales bacterium]|nr:phosphodiesterase [Rhodospirillales bacterium]
MIIAQITDLHLRTDGEKLKGMIDSVAALQTCLDHLGALRPRPDVILATGDLANRARVQDYATLRRMLESVGIPFYVIPGNHDERGLMRETFSDRDDFPKTGEFLHYAIEDHPLRLIGLDTKSGDRVGGEMCEIRLDWLRARLEERPHTPTLIFMHHPPFKTGIGFMDKDEFIGADAMEALIANHSQVEGIICGHLHRQITRRWAGTIISTAPSVAFQMVLDLAEAAPSGFVLEPPACPIFLWRPEMGLVGHMSLIGDFGPRHPFVSDSAK